MRRQTLTDVYGMIFFLLGKKVLKTKGIYQFCQQHILEKQEKNQMVFMKGMRFVKNPDRNQPLSCVVYFSKIFKVAVLASHGRNFGKMFG